MLHRLLLLPLLAILLLSGCATSLSISEMFPDRESRRVARAAASGDIRELERLIASGVDINAQGKDGMTPLLWAAYKRNERGFEYLLENGANPNIIACSEQGACLSAVHATLGPKMPIWWLETVLKYGGDPNLHGERLKPPLFELLRPETKSKEKLELLKHAGADLNAGLGNFEMTPLITAVGRNHYDVVYWLLEMGADPMAEGRQGTFVTYLLSKFTLDPSSHLYPWQKKVEQWLIQRDYLQEDFKYQND